MILEKDERIERVDFVDVLNEKKQEASEMF